MDTPSPKHIFYALFVFAALFLSGIDGYAGSKDVARIDSLNKEAQASSYYSFPRARALAIAANEDAVRYAYIKGQIASTCILSVIAVCTNDAKGACNDLYGFLSLPSNHDLRSRQLVYLTLSTCWYYRGDFDSARKYCEGGLKLFAGPEVSLEYASACLIAAKVYNKKGMATRAIDCYNKAKNVLDHMPDRETLAMSNDVLGTIYYRQRLYRQAITVLNDAYAGFKAEGDLNGMITSTLQRGNAYFMLIKDDSARRCYDSSLAYARRLGDSMSMGVNYSNISRILLENKRPYEAIAYAEQALKIIKPGNNLSVELSAYQQLGDIYAQIAQFPKAIEYINKGLTAARASDNKAIVCDCYKSLSEIYEEMKEPKKAMFWLRAAYRIKDSIQSVTFSGQLADVEAKYGMEKKETEIRLLHQQEQINTFKMLEQQEKIKRKNLLLISFGALLMATAVATYFYITRRRQAEHFRRLEAIRLAEETERQRIAKDIHDELGSGLSKIAVLSDMLNRQVNDNGRAVTTIHSISDTSRFLIDNMKDMVWNMNPENTTLENLIVRIREYSVDYLEDLPIEVITDIPADVPARKIPMDVSRNVLMIVKESLQNTVKHAQATTVKITISLTPGLRMEIADNGKGYQSDMQKNGNGVKNIAARSKAIGASLNVYSEIGKGTRITMEMALETMHSTQS